MKGKDVLRSVSMRHGALSVVTVGLQMMPMWLAGSLDSQRLVTCMR